MQLFFTRKYLGKSMALTVLLQVFLSFFWSFFPSRRRAVNKHPRNSKMAFLSSIPSLVVINQYYKCSSSYKEYGWGSLVVLLMCSERYFKNFVSQWQAFYGSIRSFLEQFVNSKNAACMPSRHFFTDKAVRIVDKMHIWRQIEASPL